MDHTVARALTVSSACVLMGACFLMGACVPTASVPDAGTSLVGCAGAACITSRPVDCTAAERGLEFAPFMIADFEGGSAQYMYTYTDQTSALRSGDTILTSGYQPPAVPEPRCTGGSAGGAAEDGNQVLHLHGGPFLGWGGGLGIAMEHLSQENPARLCAGNPPAHPEFCPPSTGQTAVDNAQLDVSQWDGVAFWARRGTASEPLLRVLVGDKHTDEDISYLMYQNDSDRPRYCERLRECACFGTVRCDFYHATPAAGYYCGPPGSMAGAGLMSGPSTATNTCNTTACDADYPAYPGAGDTLFVGKSCTPHAFRNGTQSSFCFNPGDAPPPEPDAQCGDHFTFPLHLTTDWQLYLAPFSSMSQQGWAKKAPYLDLKTVSVVRLTWGPGIIDAFIDNIRFYRTARR